MIPKDMATELYERLYKSLPPVDFGSASARDVLVPAIAELFEEIDCLGKQLDVCGKLLSVANLGRDEFSMAVAELDRSRVAHIEALRKALELAARDLETAANELDAVWCRENSDARAIADDANAAQARALVALHKSHGELR